MRTIDADALKELFPDNGEGSWTYNATVKAYIDAQPTIQPDTTTHDSISAETGKNDGDRTSGDCISRQQAIDAVEKSMSENPHENEIHRGMHEHEHRHFLTILMGLPTVQPERKTGRWTPDNTDYYRTKFICSVCGESEEVPTMGFGYAPMWGYCPNCGADMRPTERRTDE